MIWRISKITKSGSNVYDPTPYLTEDEALAAIKKDLDAGYITCADMEDHNRNRIGWLQIKQRLGLP
jgi:hypothetical protein